MKTYSPQISVKLVKAIARTEVTEGVAVAARYRGVKSIDLTPFLAENLPVTTSKSVREPVGSFSIQMVDKGHPKALDTIYALVEPMDLIEIRMCGSPAGLGADKQPPVVMRGLVSAVSRSETMSGDRPARTVTINGGDFGKIMQIVQIFYLNNSVVGDNILSELAFFQKYATAGDAKVKTANDFLTSMVANLINPYLKRLTGLADAEALGAKVINQWSVESSIEGAVEPYAVASFNDVSVYSMISRLLDVGPFNELFVEDRADGVTLVCRPNPFFEAGGKLIQGKAPDAVAITDADVVSLSLNRTDAGVANYYWVQNNKWTMFDNDQAKMVAMGGAPDTFVLFDYLNARSDYYGIRKMEVETMLGPPEIAMNEAPKEGEVDSGTDGLSAWINKRRDILSRTNRDNVVFESGSISVRGNEAIRPGMQLVLTRAAAPPVSFYVPQVSHSFTPFGKFISTLTVERGTTFISRVQQENPPYHSEIDGRGIR